MLTNRPVPNEAFQKILDKIRVDPNSVSSDICIVHGCDNSYLYPWDIKFYNPEDPNHHSRYLGTCSKEHYEEAIEYYELKEFMKWENWHP